MASTGVHRASEKEVLSHTETMFSMAFVLILYVLMYSQTTNAATVAIKCDQDRWCYYVDVYPSSTSTQTMVNITNTDDTSATYYEIYLRPYILDCIHPAISLDFELIDYFDSEKYLEIYDEDNNVMMQCQGGAQQCNQYAPCLYKHPLNTDIAKDSSYKLTIFEPLTVNASCLQYHPYSIQARLMLYCDETTTTAPTSAPTLLSTTSSAVNIVNDTNIASNVCHFSNVNGCNFSIIDSLFCCYYVDADNIYILSEGIHSNLKHSDILDDIKYIKDISFSLLILYVVLIAIAIIVAVVLICNKNQGLLFGVNLFVALILLITASLSAANFGVVYGNEIIHEMDNLQEYNCYNKAGMNQIKNLEEILQQILDYNVVIMILSTIASYVSCSTAFISEPDDTKKDEIHEKFLWGNCINGVLLFILLVLININYVDFAKISHEEYLDFSLATDQLCYQPISGEYNNYITENQVSAVTEFVTTLIPSTAPTIDNQFAGSTLLLKGFNLFKNEKSGSSILDSNYIAENTKDYSTEGAICEYQSLSFTKSYSSYTEYVIGDTQQIEIEFGVMENGAGGSLSQTRKETRSASLEQQTDIFSMNLQCKVASASIVGYNEIYWNVDFVNLLRILPQSYTTGDDLDEYLDFWNQFGTHVMLNADLGGIISGAIAVDKCTVSSEFSDMSEFKACLNGEYKGIDLEACGSASDSHKSQEAVTKAIVNSKITVKGGNTAQFTRVFNTVSINKENDFQEWIDELIHSPDIIGGNLNEIHDVIRATIKIGNHNLNKDLVNVVSDITFLSIADALEAAYKYYALQLSNEDGIFGDDECKIECNDGNITIATCVCNSCKHSCCPGDIADKAHPREITLLLYFVFVCLIVIIQL